MNKNRLIGGVALVIVVLIIAVVLNFLLFGGGGQESDIGPQGSADGTVDTGGEGSTQNQSQSDIVVNDSISLERDAAFDYDKDHRFDEVDDETPVPSVVEDGLQTNQMLSKSLGLADERGVFVRGVIRGTHMDERRLTDFVVYADDDGNIDERTRKKGKWVRFNYTTPGKNLFADIQNNTSPTITETPPRTLEQTFHANIYQTLIEAGWWEPSYTTVPDENRRTILTLDFIGKPEVLVDHIDEAEEIVSYGGEIEVEESGAITKYAITITYLTSGGEEGVLVSRGSFSYGLDDVYEPDWAGNYTSDDQQEVTLVNGEYFEIHPKTDIPQGSDLLLTVDGTQYEAPTPEIDAGDTVYVWIDEEGVVNIDTQRPNPNTVIGGHWELIIEVDGGIELSDSN